MDPYSTMDDASVRAAPTTQARPRLRSHLWAPFKPTPGSSSSGADPSAAPASAAVLAAAELERTSLPGGAQHHDLHTARSLALQSAPAAACSPAELATTSTAAADSSSQQGKQPSRQLHSARSALRATQARPHLSRQYPVVSASCITLTQLLQMSCLNARIISQDQQYLLSAYTHQLAQSSSGSAYDI